jgi:hypothetical protein
MVLVVVASLALRLTLASCSCRRPPPPAAHTQTTIALRAPGHDTSPHHRRHLRHPAQGRERTLAQYQGAPQ